MSVLKYLDEEDVEIIQEEAYQDEYMHRDRGRRLANEDVERLAKEVRHLKKKVEELKEG